ncbi:Peroxidase 17 [Linum perenne]
MSLQLATVASAIATLTFLLLIISFSSSSTSATATTTVSLRRGYYSKTCPQAESIVRHLMIDFFFSSDRRSLASVMRFQFHDCFVIGCDASLLLDDTETMLEVVDQIKSELEKSCPGVVSCADIIIMASRDAVSLTGGPYWQVKLGRLDSLTASQADADAIMPSPRANATMLIDLFAKFNLSIKDMVALSGSHSIGRGRCFSIQFRLYNQSGSEPWYRQKLMELCPQGGDESVIVGLDSTPLVFDNAYFQDLVGGRGFLNSDQTLFTHPLTRKYVEEFSRDHAAFFDAFAEGMIKMGDLQSGLPGEVRTNCHVVNGGREVRDELDRLSSCSSYLVQEF